jgi:ParB family chromosome partitioning protein
MSRKDTLNSIFLKKPEAPAPAPAKPAERVRTGAISAMGSSLQEMTETARAASRLQQQLAAGEVVLSLDPSQVEGSKIADRIPIEVDPGFDELVLSISAHGQQVPILVRPHPEKAGQFQIAYGRRRLRAAEKLGRPVMAVVRKLTDVEMVVAQGRENLDRADLSFIEKAFFAKHLEDAGFDRATITAALSTDKADLSRYIATARRIPDAVVARIGPAPKAGRARWLALADKIDDAKVLALVERTLDDPMVVASDSDTRFQAVWKALDKPPRKAASRADAWTTPQGKRAGHLERADGKTLLVFNEKVVPDFAAFVSSRLDQLYAEFLARKEPGAEREGE